MWTTYRWIIEDEESELFSEEFFTQVWNGDAKEHKKCVRELFPDEKCRCLGQITQEEAEMMGLDTY